MCMNLEFALEKLSNLASNLIDACKKRAFDGTILFTPDGVGNYDALWTRDFAYIVEYCGDLMEPAEIRGCIEYTIARQREDGWIPDRSELGGDAVYAAGAKGAPVGRANLDNTLFLVFAVYFCFRHISLISLRSILLCGKMRWIEVCNVFLLTRVGLFGMIRKIPILLMDLRIRCARPVDCLWSLYFTGGHAG